MKVLVTGASGFVGRTIAGYLAEQGHAVSACARDPAALAVAPGITPRALPDLEGDVDWRPLLAEIDAVVHAAGLAHQPAGTDEARMMRVNAEAAARLAAAAAAAGIGRFVLISSIRAMTGPTAPAALTEADPARPTDAYGRSKLAGERLVRDALGTAVVLRPTVVHGAGAKANMAKLARLARLPLPLPIGSLAGRRSLVSDRNLAAAAAFALMDERTRGGLFHVTDGEALTVPAMIAAMRRSLGRAAGTFGLPAGLDARLVRLLLPGLYDQLGRDLVADDAKLVAAGWTPVETSAAGLARLVQAASGRQTRL
ncbi:3 beta-hydroxysteroid dehydrogenase/Delta 5--_4-isomerase [bacterium YEK0313]|nr:3 beta-hydroxysteroid dehydrogenase/Delta 5-->4-isomerase [bacterium YEK0313]